MNNELKEIIQNSKYLVAFCGAGVSTASGIPDFRSSNGIYKERYGIIPIETIISHSFFIREPKIFFEVYKSKLCYKDALPNYCHKALSLLEKKDILKAVITQNIDSLDTDAGTSEVIELHGSVRRNFCMKCHKFYPLSYVLDSNGVPTCECGGIVKPDVVLYEEPLSEETISKTISHLSKADTLLILGTSLSVYPAASFISYFHGRNVVVINKTSTPIDSKATLVINDDLNKVFYDLFFI